MACLCSRESRGPCLTIQVGWEWLESSGGFFTHMTGAWAGMTKRQSSAWAIDQEGCIQSFHGAWSLPSMAAVCQEKLSEVEHLVNEYFTRSRLTSLGPFLAPTQRPYSISSTKCCGLPVSPRGQPSFQGSPMRLSLDGGSGKVTWLKGLRDGRCFCSHLRKRHRSRLWRGRMGHEMHLAPFTSFFTLGNTHRIPLSYQLLRASVLALATLCWKYWLLIFLPLLVSKFATAKTLFLSVPCALHTWHAIDAQVFVH